MSDFAHFHGLAQRLKTVVAVVKAAMDLVGLAGGAVRPPMSALEPYRVERVRGMLQAWGVLAPTSR